MAQPWQTQGAVPLSDKTSSKQDRRHRSERRDSEHISRNPAGVPRSTNEAFYRRTDSGSTDDELKDSGIGLPIAHSRRPSSASNAILSSSMSYAGQARLPQPVQAGKSTNTYSQDERSLSKIVHTHQNESGAATHTRTDSASGVKSTVATGPASKITAPELLKQGVSVHKSLLESRGSRKATGSNDKTIPLYKVKSNVKESFKIGNVIELLWTEPINQATTLTHFARDIGSTRTRRVVVIREGTTCCAALPISTYGGRGAGAPGVVRSHHAIIFTSRDVPGLLPGEAPTYIGSVLDSLRHPIRVVPADRSHRLDEHSRLNFAKIYQIAYATCEIYVFGSVAQESRHHLLYQFVDVQQQLARPFHITGVQQSVDQYHEERQPLGQPGPTHARVDSVQQHQPKAPESDESSEASDDESSDDSPEEDQESTPQQAAAGTNPETLAQQLSSLSLRAQRLGADLRGLTDQQRQLLAQLPPGNQTRAMLNLLQRQDPRRYEQVVNALRNRQAAHDSDEDDAN